MTATMVPIGQVGGAPPSYVHSKKSLWQRMWKGRWGYVFVLLPVAHFLVFFMYPVILALVASFYNYDNFQWKPLENPLYNYQRAVRDPFFRRAFLNVFVLFIVSWGGGQTISLMAAMALNSVRRFASLLRTLYFIPLATSVVVAAAIFKWLFGSSAHYPANLFLSKVLGLEPIRWLWDETLIMPTIGIIALWLGMAFNIVIWTAGIRGIPVEYYELALLEGATFWQKLWYITLPLLKPIIIYQTVMGVIGTMKEFTLVFTIFFVSSGELGASSSVIPHIGAVTPVLMIYGYGFRQFQMGYASAIAYIMTAVLLVFAVIQFKFFGTTTTYE